MSQRIGRNRKHWKILIDGKTYLSASESFDDTVFSVLRRHLYSGNDIEWTEMNQFGVIHYISVLRPREMSFAEFQRRVENGTL